MDNKDIINGLLKQLTDGLSTITETSYPLCKNIDASISSQCSKINNIAFDLKKAIVLLQNQINFSSD
jgi:hypothetical protein